ncbi:LysM peptidoglycan-binding domain-containing protein [Virgibacillus flavescens]|uniref:3D domain-containing protein n=1 Tax=Virgibacillus flavescens TaxID=1611422 RepID=UPI003D349B62
MKKLVALFVGLLIIGVAATTASAAENEYKVQKGDTLWNIAIDHHTNVDELMEINELDSSLILPNQVLKVKESNIEYYTVKKGDTLTHISKTYGNSVTIANLKEWNELPSDLIITGQQLVVNGEKPIHKKVKKRTERTTHTTTQVSKNESAKAKERNVKSKDESKDKKIDGRTFSVEATAYTAYCTGCSGITATGVNLKANPNAKVIAVDPNVIPLGTKVYVEGYGYAVAADTGGAIKGNKIDLHVPTKNQAYSWGRRTVKITIVN